MTDICQREGVKRNQVTLHSDNGSPMKGATMLATLQQLGVKPSVSNDNPYSESLFRTLKYRPEYPERPFNDLQAARSWVCGFVEWYNHEHLHSGVKFVTRSSVTQVKMYTYWLNENRYTKQQNQKIQAAGVVKSKTGI